MSRPSPDSRPLPADGLGSPGEDGGRRPHRSRDFGRHNPRLDRERLGAAFATVRVGKRRLTLGSDGSVELHDLRADPQQLRNLAASEPEWVRELAARLRDSLPARATAEPPPSLDAVLRQRIRSLGYFDGH